MFPKSLHRYACGTLLAPGIHPGAEDNKFYEYDPDKWSNTVFGQPKYLHFHTCGTMHQVRYVG